MSNSRGGSFVSWLKYVFSIALGFCESTNLNQKTFQLPTATACIENASIMLVSFARIREVHTGHFFEPIEVKMDTTAILRTMID